MLFEIIYYVLFKEHSWNINILNRIAMFLKIELSKVSRPCLQKKNKQTN